MASDYGFYLGECQGCETLNSSREEWAKREKYYIAEIRALELKLATKDFKFQTMKEKVIGTSNVLENYRLKCKENEFLIQETERAKRDCERYKEELMRIHTNFMPLEQSFQERSYMCDKLQKELQTEVEKGAAIRQFNQQLSEHLKDKDREIASWKEETIRLKDKISQGKKDVNEVKRSVKQAEQKHLKTIEKAIMLAEILDSNRLLSKSYKKHMQAWKRQLQFCIKQESTTDLPAGVNEKLQAVDCSYPAKSYSNGVNLKEDELEPTLEKFKGKKIFDSNRDSGVFDDMTEGALDDDDCSEISDPEFECPSLEQSAFRKSVRRERNVVDRTKDEVIEQAKVIQKMLRESMAVSRILSPMPMTPRYPIENVKDTSPIVEQNVEENDLSVIEFEFSPNTKGEAKSNENRKLRHLNSEGFEPQEIFNVDDDQQPRPITQEKVNQNVGHGEIALKETGVNAVVTVAEKGINAVERVAEKAINTVITVAEKEVQTEDFFPLDKSLNALRNECEDLEHQTESAQSNISADDEEMQETTERGEQTLITSHDAVLVEQLETADEDTSWSVGDPDADLEITTDENSLLCATPSENLICSSSQILATSNNKPSLPTILPRVVLLKTGRSLHEYREMENSLMNEKQSTTSLIQVRCNYIPSLEIDSRNDSGTEISFDSTLECLPNIQNCSENLSGESNANHQQEKEKQLASDDTGGDAQLSHEGFGNVKAVTGSSGEHDSSRKEGKEIVENEDKNGDERVSQEHDVCQFLWMEGNFQTDVMNRIPFGNRSNRLRSNSRVIFSKRGSLMKEFCADPYTSCKNTVENFILRGRMSDSLGDVNEKENRIVPDDNSVSKSQAEECELDVDLCMQTSVCNDNEFSGKCDGANCHLNVPQFRCDSQSLSCKKIQSSSKESCKEGKSKDALSKVKSNAISSRRQSSRKLKSKITSAQISLSDVNIRTKADVLCSTPKESSSGMYVKSDPQLLTHGFNESSLVSVMELTTSNLEKTELQFHALGHDGAYSSEESLVNITITSLDHEKHSNPHDISQFNSTGVLETDSFGIETVAEDQSCQNVSSSSCSDSHADSCNGREEGILSGIEVKFQGEGSHQNTIESSEYMDDLPLYEPQKIMRSARKRIAVPVVSDSDNETVEELQAENKINDSEKKTSLRNNTEKHGMTMQLRSKKPYDRVKIGSRKPASNKRKSSTKKNNEDNFEDQNHSIYKCQEVGRVRRSSVTVKDVNIPSHFKRGNKTDDENRNTGPLSETVESPYPTQANEDETKESKLKIEQDKAFKSERCVIAPNPKVQPGIEVSENEKSKESACNSLDVSGAPTPQKVAADLRTMKEEFVKSDSVVHTTKSTEQHKRLHGKCSDAKVKDSAEANIPKALQKKVSKLEKLRQRLSRTNPLAKGSVANACKFNQPSEFTPRRRGRPKKSESEPKKYETQETSTQEGKTLFSPVYNSTCTFSNKNSASLERTKHTESKPKENETHNSAKEFEQLSSAPQCGSSSAAPNQNSEKLSPSLPHTVSFPVKKLLPSLLDIPSLSSTLTPMEKLQRRLSRNNPIANTCKFTEPLELKLRRRGKMRKVENDSKTEEVEVENITPIPVNIDSTSIKSIENLSPSVTLNDSCEEVCPLSLSVSIPPLCSPLSPMQCSPVHRESPLSPTESIYEHDSSFKSSKSKARVIAFRQDSGYSSLQNSPEGEINEDLLTSEISLLSASVQKYLEEPKKMRNCPEKEANTCADKAIQREVIKSCLNKLRAEELTSEKLHDIVGKLGQENLVSGPAKLARYIVRYLMLDTDTELDRSFTPPAPPLTKLQQKLVLLIVQIQNRWKHLSSLMEQVLLGINYRLFRLGHTPEVSKVCNLARFYTASCKVLDDRNRVLILCYDALFCMGYRALTLIFTVLTCWPEIIPRAIPGKVLDPVEQTFIFVIMNQDATNAHRDFKILTLKELLKTVYGYEYGNTTAEVLLQNLIERLKDPVADIANLEEAIILLAKRQGWEWTDKKLIKGQLLHLVERWERHEVPDDLAVKAIRVMGPVARSFPNEGALAVRSLIERLGVFLEKSSSVPYEVQEAVVNTLLYLGRQKYIHIAKLIEDWKPSTEVPAELVDHMNRFVSSRNQKWWRIFLSKQKAEKQKDLDAVSNPCNN